MYEIPVALDFYVGGSLLRIPFLALALENTRESAFGLILRLSLGRGLGVLYYKLIAAILCPYLLQYLGTVLTTAADNLVGWPN